MLYRTRVERRDDDDIRISNAKNNYYKSTTRIFGRGKNHNRGFNNNVVAFVRINRRVQKKKIKNRRYTVKNDENKNNNITTTIFRARRWRRRNEPDTREQRTDTGWHRAVDLAGAA